LKKAYYYVYPLERANAQILRQDNAEGSFYYVHDRLGSVRLMTDDCGTVVNSYSYSPFGEDFATETAEQVYNSFKFTGQWWDSEIGQYYLRARQYDPQIMRFTARDPAWGEPQKSLTLHKYLYCLNDPLNNTDPNGEISLNVANGLKAATEVYAAGLGIAAYGASEQNFDLIELGAAIQQLSPLAFAFGYASTGNIVQVTRWGGSFKPGSYGVQGSANFFNYLKTMKWLPNQYASFSDAQTAYYLADTLYMPRGALRFMDVLFGFVNVPF
jgi:RHS repeat-associated protein